MGGKVDTGDKFITGVVDTAEKWAGDSDTDDKFFTDINNTGEQLSPVTTALAINLLPVLTTPVNNDRQWQWHRW